MVDHVHDALLDLLFQWDFTVLEQFKVHWGVWALLTEATQGAIDSVHARAAVQAQDGQVESLACALAVAIDAVKCAV